MDDIDTMLMRLAAVPAPSPLGDDPGFVARLEASATRGEQLGAMRSLAIGLAIAGLMVAGHPAPAIAVGAPGFLLATAGGEVL